MERLFAGIARHRKTVLITFFCALTLSVFFASGVSVNYDFARYLPEESPSTKALRTMDAAFGGGSPNARVLVENVSLPDALAIQSAIAEAPGVTAVQWLNDVADAYAPLSVIDADTLDALYRDGAALYTVTVDPMQAEVAIPAVRAAASYLGHAVSMTGQAVYTAEATNTASREIALSLLFVIPMAALILLVTTTSYWEPVLFLITIGVAIFINRGTNLFFGEISYVTNAAASILQLAVSLDYCIFLLHRFNEFREQGLETEPAMVAALRQSANAILSSGLTTVIGFLALVFMRFGIGPDMGWVMAKAIVISLFCALALLPVFTILTYRTLDRLRHKRFLPQSNLFARFVRKARVPALLLFCLLLIPAFLASNRSEYQYGSSNLFGRDTRVYRERARIESIYGKCAQMALLVPEGDLPRETALSRSLREIPEVTSVLSYVDNAGAEIPVSFVDVETASLLYSGGYSRFVIEAATDSEGPCAFAVVEEVRARAQALYSDTYLLAGDTVSTYDMRDTVMADMRRVNAIAILAVVLVLFFTTRSFLLPLILVLVIEVSIWLNLSFPYFQGTELFYFAYLIISSIQLGATVDYAILFSTRYLDERKRLCPRDAVAETVRKTALSIGTSACMLMIGGYTIALSSTIEVISQLGRLVGRGAILSVLLVLTVLPALLTALDRPIRRWTLGTSDGRSIFRRRRRT